MVFEGGVDGDVEIVLTTGLVGEFLEEEIGREGRVSTGIKSYRTALQGRKEFGGEMCGRGVGHPDRLGKEFAQHNGRGLGLDNRDVFRRLSAI